MQQQELLSCSNTLAEKIKKRKLICKTDYVDSLQDDFEALGDQAITSLAVVTRCSLFSFTFLAEVQYSRGGSLMLHAAVSIFVGIREGMGPAHASEAGVHPPFQTRALGKVLARPVLGLC